MALSERDFEAPELERSRSLQETSTSDAGQMLKSGAEKTARLATRAVSSSLKNKAEKTARSVTNDNSAAIKSRNRGKLQSSQINSSVLKTGQSAMSGTLRGKRNSAMQPASRYGNRLVKNEAKLGKATEKLNQKLKTDRIRDYHFQGNGVTNSMKLVVNNDRNKFAASKLHMAEGKAANAMGGALRFANQQLKDDSGLGLQNAWTETASRAVDAGLSVYKVSRAVKNFRMIRSERKIAKLAKMQDKLVRKSFKLEFKDAWSRHKASSGYRNANLLQKAMQKRMYKKQYQKAAYKQYQAARKLGNQSKVLFSTGKSLAGAGKDAAARVVNIIRKSFSLKKAVIIAVIFLLMMLPTMLTSLAVPFFSVFATGEESETDASGGGFPEDVMQWQEWVSECCEKLNDAGSKTDLTKFVDAVLAIIWQESGGRSEASGGDLMQCHESGLWDDDAIPEDWTTEQYSIWLGTKIFYAHMQEWGVTEPDDYDGLQIVAQAYNYGGAFMGWAKAQHADKWTKELSQGYSDKMKAELGVSAYGHVPYGEEWLEKYQSGGSNVTEGQVYKIKGASGVVKTALAQEGITESPKDSNNVIYNTEYYGHEVSGNYPWCGVFVWWCFKQSGNLDAIKGISNPAASWEYANWGDAHGGNVPLTEGQYGDIAVINNNTHVCIIVENLGGGNYKTIDGNTSSSDAGSQDNGGCVAQRTRSTSGSFRITNIIRPKYSTEE